MATGDLKRSLRKLEQALRLLNYPKEVDYVGLIKGETSASLPIISYSLTSYSPYVTELLMDSNIELVAKNDMRFTDTVYKLLRDQFDYKPILTKKQFIQCGFAEWKIQIICDVLNFVMKKHKELTGLEKMSSHQRKKMVCDKVEPCSSSDNTSSEAVCIDITGKFLTPGKKKALVIRHLYDEDNDVSPEDAISSGTDVSEGFDVVEKTTKISIPEVQVCAVKTEKQDINDNPEIATLQTMLADCQEKLKKLTWIETRLEALEEAMKGKVMVEEKTWNNLLSRVTLLETEMLLFKKEEMLLSKKNEYIELNAESEDYASIGEVDHMPYDSQGTMEEQEPPSLHQFSGYSTVSVDSTPQSSTVNYCGLKDFSEETTLQKMERMKKMFEETAELLKCSGH